MVADADIFKYNAVCMELGHSDINGIEGQFVKQIAPD